MIITQVLIVVSTLLVSSLALTHVFIYILLIYSLSSHESWYHFVMLRVVNFTQLHTNNTWCGCWVHLYNKEREYFDDISNTWCMQYTNKKNSTRDVAYCLANPDISEWSWKFPVGSHNTAGTA